MNEMQLYHRRMDVTDLGLLKKCINDSGMKMNAIAKKSGIARGTLYNRLNGIGEFTATEIVGLSNVLHMDDSLRDRVFLSKKLYNTQLTTV